MADENRRAHVKASRSARRERRAWMAETLGISQRRFGNWRSWLHHPLANVVWWWWGWMPHRPVWTMVEATWGEVDHEGWSDADGGWIWLTCERCGLAKDEGA